MKKKKIAVFFGGRSPEHDVSIVSGLQVLQALDREKYDPFPVYVTTYGRWYIGDALKERKNYFFSEQTLKDLTPVMLDVTLGKGALLPTETGFFSKKDPILFDIAMPVFHGLHGEDGGFQGLMEFANIPYAGMRAKACSTFMDKDTTKKALAGVGIAQLPYIFVNRPETGLMIAKETLQDSIDVIGFPCCIKPANLGSSIGVGKANNIDEARAILADIFKQDIKAVIEPFVANRIEYNVAVRRAPSGKIEISAIERPKSTQELLDFKEKYLSGGGKKSGTKSSAPPSEGMLSLTREINPKLDPVLYQKIETWAKDIFTWYDPAGAPRIDFMSDTKSGELWFNELNPIPGSYAYFLWESSRGHILFTQFLTDLLDEAERLHMRKQIARDPVPNDAQLFKRHNI